MKRCSASHIISEKHIKTTIRYHLTPVRMAEIKKHKKQKVLEGMWRKGNPLALLVVMQTSKATLENSMDIPQKVKNRTTLQSSNRTTKYLLKEY